MKTKQQKAKELNDGTLSNKELEEKKLPDWVRTLEDGTQVVQEGSAQILYNDNVFYNPIQEFNRDMSIAAITVFSQLFLRDKVLAEKKKRKRTTSSSDSDRIQHSGNKEEDASNVTTPSQNEKMESESSSIPTLAITSDHIQSKGDDKTTNGRTQSKEESRLEKQMKALKHGAQKVAFEKIDLTAPEYVDKNITIFEALSATGLRSIRYAKEIPHVSEIVANDMDADAVQSITNNIKHNIVEHIARSSQGDARLVMYKMLGESKQYDVIDIDPYGTASPFLDAAVQAVSNGGLLCVTCTDAAVLAGSQPESCWAKYGSINIPQAPYTHELALRIMLHAIQTAAARYHRYIEPLASCSIDYYFRVFVRVHESRSIVKQAPSKTAMVYHCTGCKSFALQPIGKPHNDSKSNSRFGPALAPTVGQFCEHCNKKFHIAGPFYTEPIHNDEFLCRMLDHVRTSPQSKYGTMTRMAGMLMVMNEELPIPLYFSLPQMCNVLHCSTISRVAFASAILNQGYKVSSSHAQPQSIKTDAPHSVLWDILRGWCKQHPPKNDSESSPGYIILSKSASFEPEFTKHESAEPLSQKLKLVRFQENPTANWGPQSRPRKKAKD